MAKMNGNWYALRWRVLNRDNFTCQYCGQSAPAVLLHVDHILPRAAGGLDVEENLVTACGACNVGKNLSIFTVPGGSETAVVKGRPGEKVLHKKITQYLRVTGMATATEIARALNRPTDRANISHLLSSSSEFVKVKREGANVLYALAETENGKPGREELLQQ